MYSVCIAFGIVPYKADEFDLVSQHNEESKKKKEKREKSKKSKKRKKRDGMFFDFLDRMHTVILTGYAPQAVDINII